MPLPCFYTCQTDYTPFLSCDHSSPRYPLDPDADSRSFRYTSKIPYKNHKWISSVTMACWCSYLFYSHAKCIHVHRGGSSLRK